MLNISLFSLHAMPLSVAWTPTNCLCPPCMSSERTKVKSHWAAPLPLTPPPIPHSLTLSLLLSLSLSHSYSHCHSLTPSRPPTVTLWVPEWSERPSLVRCLLAGEGSGPRLPTSGQILAPLPPLGGRMAITVLLVCGYLMLIKLYNPGLPHGPHHPLHTVWRDKILRHVVTRWGSPIDDRPSSCIKLCPL